MGDPNGTIRLALTDSNFILQFLFNEFAKVDLFDCSFFLFLGQVNCFDAVIIRIEPAEIISHVEILVVLQS